MRLRNDHRVGDQFNLNLPKRFVDGGKEGAGHPLARNRYNQVGLSITVAPSFSLPTKRQDKQSAGPADLRVQYKIDWSLSSAVPLIVAWWRLELYRFVNIR